MSLLLRSPSVLMCAVFCSRLKYFLKALVEYVQIQGTYFLTLDGLKVWYIGLLERLR
jgi:hypothetical protein